MRARPVGPVYFCTYIMVEGFEWDPGKAATNAEKHGVDFAETVEVFLNEGAR